MYIKLINNFDVSCFEESLTSTTDSLEMNPIIMPAVLDKINEVIGILDASYGLYRHPTHSLGGQLFYFPTLEDVNKYYGKVLEFYNTSTELAEYSEIIASDENLEFWYELYILSTDYCIALILMRKK